MNLDYKKDVRIDETALDLEWLDQAELAISYGKEWAILRKKVALLDEKVKVIRSKLIRKAWENPEKYLGQPKATAQTVEAFYRTHKKHQKAKQLYIEAQEELDLVEVAKNEISFTRKGALENLVKLHAADWFAGPNVPRDITSLRSERNNDRQDSVDKQVKRKRNKSKRKN